MTTPEEPAVLQRIHRLLSSRRREVALLVYAGAAACAYSLAYLLRFEFRIPAEHLDTLLVTLPVLLGVRLVSDSLFRLYGGRWRYVGVREVLRLGGATLLGSLVFFLLVTVWGLAPQVPRSVLLVEGLLTANLKAGAWILYRLLWESSRRRGDGRLPERRALLIGAGEGGSRLAREMLRSQTGYRPVGFVDDDPLKVGTSLHGLRVLGRVGDLPRLVERYGVEELIVAMPSADPRALREVVDRCMETRLPYKVLPPLGEVFQEESAVTQLREVRIDDLLGRDPVKLSLPELAEDLSGKSVLITGAAGSIGSELARQVALHRPARLVLLDQAESDLYFLELELKAKHREVEVVPVVCDILDRGGLERCFRRHQPQRVFHAAAYKHVPMMEENVREAIRNNVVGTWRVAEVSGRSGVEKFCLVSTDKAVRPANVMGATKRLAELILLGAQARYPGSWFVAVRFGNVLGSQGSVIPLFQRQLANGRELTVTDPQVTRYFMTIPEAVQLILQATLLEEARGRIAMLEMGEPVLIADLARNLVRLAGLREGIDAHIRFIGLRPGEKLHEELVSDDEQTTPTRVERVRVVGNSAAARGLEALLAEVQLLEQVTGSRDDAGLRVDLQSLLVRYRQVGVAGRGTERDGAPKEVAHRSAGD